MFVFLKTLAHVKLPNLSLGVVCFSKPGTVQRKKREEMAESIPYLITTQTTAVFLMQ